MVVAAALLEGDEGRRKDRGEEGEAVAVGLELAEEKGWSFAQKVIAGRG